MGRTYETILITKNEPVIFCLKLISIFIYFFNFNLGFVVLRKSLPIQNIYYGFKKKYLFIWLHQVLVVANGLLSCASRAP